jgi:delta 1-pyrroline-5-carboxylate dehydrogenase
MDHRDAEMSDIVVVMDDCAGANIDELVARLTSLGVTVEEVDRDNCTVEGAVVSTQLPAIHKLANVKYVRDVFNYVADYPVGDPRNLDADDEGDEHIPR